MNIDPFDENIYKEIKSRWDKVAKPLDSLGRFEDIIARIGAVQKTNSPDISRRAVVMVCADNGIVEEGVSQSGQDVTREVASWMGKGISSVCRMAAVAGVETIPVDMGINMDGSPEGVIDMKVMKGTRNFARENAMTFTEASAAIKNGTEIVRMCSEEGCRILATGEMGIGNTTTSSALASALLDLPAEAVTGRGAGLSDTGLHKKTEVIRTAVSRLRKENNGSDYKSPGFAARALCCVGGLDIAGLAGIFIGGAKYNVPVVIDGFISAVAALVAERMCPGCKKSMIASHIGREPGMKMILKELGLEPVIDAQLSLGEGTGAVMLFPLLDMAMSLYSGGLEFAETEVEQYVHFSPERNKTVCLIIGSPDSGKSALAEEMICSISGDRSKYYIATMIPYGEEGSERVAKHRRMREGKGFTTIEVPFDLGNAYVPAGSNVLLECVSNLTANELFERKTPADICEEKIVNDILTLADSAENLVIVTNHFEIDKNFDDETVQYSLVLDRINSRLGKIADRVIDLTK